MVRWFSTWALQPGAAWAHIPALPSSWALKCLRFLFSKMGMLIIVLTAQGGGVDETHGYGMLKACTQHSLDACVIITHRGTPVGLFKH